MKLAIGSQIDVQRLGARCVQEKLCTGWNEASKEYLFSQALLQIQSLCICMLVALGTGEILATDGGDLGLL